MFRPLLIMRINFLHNTSGYTYLGRLKNVISNRGLKGLKPSKDFYEKFQPLKYEKAFSIGEGKNFACMNFKIYDIACNNVKDINLLNSCLCNIYNMNKGKISFPPIIKLYKHKNQRYSGLYGNNIITLNTAFSIFPTLAHEIGHYNHEITSANYEKMGKKNELIECGIKDFSILESFLNDKKSLMQIRKEVSGYACSSPAEFVACTFEAIMCHKKLSPEIIQLYRKYEGPNAKILKQQLDNGKKQNRKNILTFLKKYT